MGQPAVKIGHRQGTSVFLIADNISIRTLCSSDIFESKIQKECGATCREKEVDASISSSSLPLRAIFVFHKKKTAHFDVSFFDGIEIIQKDRLKVGN